MRLKVLIKDFYYKRAFLDSIADFDKNIIVDVIDINSFQLQEEFSLIITDMDPMVNTDFNISGLKRRLVYLSPKNIGNEINSNEFFFTIFKYKSISNIISDISLINYEISGELSYSNGTSRIISVCGDSNEACSLVSYSLARQIRFRNGGSILLISLSHINEYPYYEGPDENLFSRLLYYIELGRAFSIDQFTFDDSYEISYLKIGPGLNPLSYIDASVLFKLLSEFCLQKYEIVIMDVSNCYSESNCKLLGASDNIIFVSANRSKLAPEDITSDTSTLSKIKTINLNSEQDAELSVDDYIKEIFNITSDTNDEKQEKNNKKIQRRDKRYFK